MTIRTLLACEGQWDSMPCRGALPIKADRRVRDIARRAGWSRRHGRDLCPAHSRIAATEENAARVEWQRTCEKVPYPTFRDARKALTQLTVRRAVTLADRMEDHAYECPRCSAWHLTSKTLRESW